MEQTIVGVIFIILGGFVAIRPDLFLAFQILVQKIILGATYTPSKRTHTVVKFIGVFLLLIGLSSITGFFEQSSKKAPPTYNEMTFCEKLINVKRMISSSIIVPEFDVSEDEYYTRGIVSAPINFDGKYSEAKNFKTVITKSVFEGSGPNFAGHYTVAGWGCGANCHSYAIIDNNTGDIVAYGLGSEYGAEYSLDSKLLILNPKEQFPTLNESDTPPYQAAQTFARIPREYYILESSNSTGESFLRSFCTESAGSHYLK